MKNIKTLLIVINDKIDFITPIENTTEIKTLITRYK